MHWFSARHAVERARGDRTKPAASGKMHAFRPVFFGGDEMTRPMTRKLAVALVASVLACAIAPLAGAHHSVAGQFDINHTVTLSGVVSEVHWVNPHIYIEFA